MVIPETLGIVFLSVYSFCLSVILIYAVNSLYLLIQSKKNNQSKKSLSPFTLQQHLPVVTVQLPVFNEKYVVGSLLETITTLQYPKEKLQIQVLDDSTDETRELVHSLVEKYKLVGFRISHFHRMNRVGFKAGALREGLEKADGEFIAIFDADFAPDPNFLLKMLPYFEDEKVGLVQARWKHMNEKISALTKVQAMGLDGHFLIEQEGRNSGGLCINFNGTAGVFRKTCIWDSGNWQDDTITEDLDLSYRAQLKGWKFIFRSDITCLGELPEDISSWKSQQFRWTKGAIETCRKIVPLIWKSDFTFGMKIQSTLHLTVNLVYPMILIAGILNVPLLIIKNQASNPSYSLNWMGIFILSFISSVLIYWFIQNRSENGFIAKIRLFPIYLAFSAGLSINNTKALISALFKRKSEFVRTPKFHILDSKPKFAVNGYLNSKMNFQIIIEIIFGLYCFYGAALAVYFSEFAVLPFILLFGIGYLMMGLFSLRQIAEKYQKEIV